MCDTRLRLAGRLISRPLGSVPFLGQGTAFLVHRKDKVMPSGSPSPSSWVNWPVWVALNTAGVLSAYALSIQLPAAGQFIDLQVSDRTIITVMVPLIGLALAVAQWLLVRLHIRRATLWIPATFVGWATPIVLLVAFFPPSLANQQSTIGAALASIGLTMGAAQYLVLRPYKPHSGWWIPASVLGWTILAIDLPILITNQLAILKVGAIPALITGIPFAVFVCTRSPFEAKDQTLNAA